MITVYSREDNATRIGAVTSVSDFPSETCWIDIVNPTEGDLEIVQTSLKVGVPDKREVWRNHVLNRFYMEEGVAYMTAAVINKSNSKFPETSAVTFILGPTFLLTMREIEPTSFKNFTDRIRKNSNLFNTSADLAEALFEEMIMRVAHNSEVVVDTLDDLSHRVFSPKAFEKEGMRNPTQIMKTILKTLGEAADLNSKINESLHSISRMLVFFKQATAAHPAKDSDIDMLTADVTALIKQSAFLSDKITFQLDATLGMINVEQNMIIKIFSIVTVFFLPATLVSSIYGMNFSHMPELHWIWGYPFALFLMVLC
ncbi:MAG TPA: CorA family divalent cation transporter, partial [Alphaproteobacteria bacterium]|nr:CorA family divalent cation transporter [Alphaproteobacteria bacterium]